MNFTIPDHMIDDEMIYIDPTGIGLYVAERLESQGLPLKRLSLDDLRLLKQRSNCEQHGNPQSS